jgi:type I restriction enzyme S subunit
LRWFGRSDIPNGKALAKCFLVPQDNRYTLNQRIGCIKPFDEIDNDYLFYKLNRNNYFLAFDSGSGQTNLKKSEIRACPVALPPTKAEQTAIATALNDADTLIQQLEQLIAKKRNIRTGAMQELLKPKEGWEEKAFTEICDLMHGHQFLSSDFVNDSDGIKVVKIGNVQDGVFNIDDCDKISKKRLQLFSKYLLKDGDVLMSLTGNIGRVIVVSNTKELLLQNYRVGKFIPKGVNNKFLAYCLAFPGTTKQLSLNSNQTSQANFGKQDFDKIRIHIPTNKKTQEDIAQILSDMDNEIQELEKQLDKYKMMKQGMMQSLLTGKIRLV